MKYLIILSFLFSSFSYGSISLPEESNNWLPVDLRNLTVEDAERIKTQILESEEFSSFAIEGVSPQEIKSVIEENLLNQGEIYLASSKDDEECSLSADSQLNYQIGYDNGYEKGHHDGGVTAVISLGTGFGLGLAGLGLGVALCFIFF